MSAIQKVTINRPGLEVKIPRPPNVPTAVRMRPPPTKGKALAMTLGPTKDWPLASRIA